MIRRQRASMWVLEAEQAFDETRSRTLRAILKPAIAKARRLYDRAHKLRRDRNHSPAEVWALTKEARRVLRLALRHVEFSTAHERYLKDLESARERRKLADRTCPVCRKSFTPKRRDAVTCSNRCRQARFRRAKP